MIRYIVKRVLLMIPTLLSVAVLVFFLMRVVPGDIVELRRVVMAHSWRRVLQHRAQRIWPAPTFGYRRRAVATRMTRPPRGEVLREDYIRTARAKGLGRQLLLPRHALKNAMLPVLTV